MASVQDQKSLNLAGNIYQQDPFINSIEVSITIWASLERMTAKQTIWQPDGVDLIDLTAQDEPDLGNLQKALRVNKSLRNYALDADHYSVKQVPVGGNNYKVGHFVELREPLGAHAVSEPTTFPFENNLGSTENELKLEKDSIHRDQVHPRSRADQGCRHSRPSLRPNSQSPRPLSSAAKRGLPCSRDRRRRCTPRRGAGAHRDWTMRHLEEEDPDEDQQAIPLLPLRPDRICYNKAARGAGTPYLPMEDAHFVQRRLSAEG